MRDETAARLKELRTRLESLGISVPSIGLGSTPSCSVQKKPLEGLTEIHPGNYVFYDAMQVKVNMENSGGRRAKHDLHQDQLQLGSCSKADVAVQVLTRVLGHQVHRGQLVVDCGFLGLTKQGFADLDNSYALVQVVAVWSDYCR